MIEDYLTAAKAIRRDSPVPYYYQLEEFLKEQIENGTWEPGQQIPSEAELCEAFDVSRTVVRQALNELVHEGVLYRRKGKGTFVAEPKIRESLVQHLTGFFEDTVALGLKPSTKVLAQKVIPAPPKIADGLGLKGGEPVIMIDRLRFVDGEPIVLVITYVPYELCPELINEDLSTQSLYAILEKKYGLELVYGRRTLEAVAATKEEAKLLEIEEGDPIVLLRSISYLKDGRPIEYFKAKHRGDRSRFEVELVRPGKARELLPDDIFSFKNLPRSNTLG
ncbi:MAG TPA: GntR family transcriptional regulator [Chloroflexi bacterium]|nr:GntR family transcriptional regulator [Chloroflexota bacterium]